MKKALAAGFLLAARIAYAAPAGSPSEDTIRNELTRQVPNCDTVAENAARMLRQKPETKTSVIAEWQNLCGSHILYRLYDLASRLDNIHVDSADIDSALWTMVKPQGRYRKKARPAGELGELLRGMAEAANPQSDDGRLLKLWFLNGDNALRTAIPRYRRSRLYGFYRAELDAAQRGAFVSMGAGLGVWLPTAGLSTLGEHPSFGFNMYGGYDRFSFGLIFDFRFGNAPQNYTFYNPNTNALQTSNTYFGLLIAPDFRYEFFRGDQLSLFAAAGFGYDLLNHHTASRYSRERAAYSESFNLNAGFALRFYFSEERGGYLEGDFRVHKAAYSDGGKGGDTFTGAYFTATLSAGYKIAFGGS